MPSAIPLDSVAAPSPPSSPPSSRRSGSRLSLRNGALAWFIAGWWFLPAGIIQEIWLWALLLPSLWFCRDDALRQLRPGGVALPTAGFLFSLLGLSAATGHLSSPDDLLRALRDIFGLLVFIISIGAAASDDQWLKTLRRVCVRMALISAVVSLIVFWGVNGAAHFGERLRNWFVHGGQHPVPTGIAWGFAAVWAGTGFTSASTPRRRLRWAVGLAILAFAMCCCQSRGAALAASGGFGILALAGRSRRSWIPLLIALAAAAAFHSVSTALAWRAEQARSNPTASLLPSQPPDPDLERLSQQGLKSWIDRGDTGRIGLYGVILRRLANNEERLFGKGWSAPDSSAAEVGWPADHPHSVWIASLYHHGQIGAAAQFLLATFLLSRAWAVYRRGRGLEPLVLLTFGIGACIFDGHSLTTFFTLPRYEPLVFWLPAALAGGRWLAPDPPSDPATPNDTSDVP